METEEYQMFTVSEIGKSIVKFNPHHAPSGSPEGGRFTSGEGNVNGQPLTTKNARDGLKITNKDHPEWGIWTMKY